MQRQFVIALAGLALTVSASTARAAYTGTISRSMCPAGAFQPKIGEDLSFYNSGCGVEAEYNGTTYAYGSMSIPFEFESGDSPTSVTSFVVLSGTDAATGSQACAETYAYDVDGNFSTSSSDECTTGTSNAVQTFNQGVNVPRYGALFTNVALQQYASFVLLSNGWTTSGS